MPNVGHLRKLPQGTRLARVLRLLFARMRDDAVSQVRAGRPVDLSRWYRVMYDVTFPVIFGYWQQGAEQTMGQIGVIYGRRKHNGWGRRLGNLVLHRKKVEILSAKRGEVFSVNRIGRAAYHRKAAAPISIEFGFNLFNPRILQYIQGQTFSFVQETLDTLKGDVQTGLEQLRGLLAFSLEEGDTQRDLTRMIGALFTDPYRASRIAITEASRAVHGGDLLAMKESGVVKGKKWLASSDACDKCLALNGKEVPIDAPFVVDAKGGPYAAVYGPPRHPFCMCSQTAVLE